MFKKIVGLCLLFSVVFSQAACFYKDAVESHQVGLILLDGVSVNEVVPPGRYSEDSWYAELKIVDVSAKTSSWNDPDLVTSDKQPIGLSIVVTYARNKSNVREMWELYHQEAVDDAALAQQVVGRIPSVAKSVTTEFSLDQMLGIAEESNRQQVETQIFSALEEELAEVYVDLLDVKITNIAVAQVYLDSLQAKAQAQINIEVAQGETALLREQYNQEVAQTDIAVELARRDNLVAEEESKVYVVSPQYFELEKLRVMADAIGRGDAVIFVPQGTDLSYIMTNQPTSGVSGSYATGASPDNQP